MWARRAAEIDEAGQDLRMRTPGLVALSFVLVSGCSLSRPASPVSASPRAADAGPIAPPLGAPDASAPPLDPPEAPPSPGVTEFTVATWNIEQFPGAGSTIETVRDVVLAEDFDLVGVQEITDPEAFVALADMLPDHEMFFSYDDWAFTRVGMLYRADRVQVSDVERLFSRESWAFPRDPLSAVITVLGADGSAAFDFTFVVVHLKAQVDEESRLRRVAAIEQLEAWVRERALIDPDVIVAGDFNDELTDDAPRNVFGPFLGAPDRYRFLTLESERTGDFSYIPFRAMIDHVLVTADALDEYGAGTTEALDLERTVPGYLHTVSDHRPVVSRFLIDPAR